MRASVCGVWCIAGVLEYTMNSCTRRAPLTNRAQVAVRVDLGLALWLNGCGVGQVAPLAKPGLCHFELEWHHRDSEQHAGLVVGLEVK